MMATFVDTSALYALLDGTDDAHGAALSWLRGPGGDPDEPLVTHNYVVIESDALVHRRLGTAAVRTLHSFLLEAIDIRFIEESLHLRARGAHLAALSRRASLVDRVSFELMHAENIGRAFAFDDDFRRQGFEVVP